MTVHVRFHPEAAAELSAAVAWYEKRRAGLGVELVRAVDSTLSLVRRFPEIGARNPAGSGNDPKRVMVPGFPYTLVHLVGRPHIIVVAVAHLRRKPGYWRHRL